MPATPAGGISIIMQRVVAVVLLVLMGGAIVAATAYLLKDCLYELGTQETMQEVGAT